MTEVTKKLIDDFSKLSLDQQKQKIIEMLSLLQESDKLFKDLLMIVQEKKDITSQDITDIYADILELGDAIKEANTEKGNDILQKIQKTIQKIHEAEEKENNNEHVEDILKII
jgi:hypothetical protein